MAFDSAGPGNNCQLVSADGGIAYPDDGFLGPQIKRDQFIRFANANGLGDTRQVFKTRRIDRALVTGDTDGRAGSARHRVRLESKFSDDVTDIRNLLIGGVGCHYN